MTPESITALRDLLKAIDSLEPVILEGDTQLPFKNYGAVLQAREVVRLWEIENGND